eukprot:jgi/Psemu1/185876/e_gw1.53.13.1
MPRWRKKNGRSGGTSIEQKLLLKYLREYKDRALAFYHSQLPLDPSSSSQQHRDSNRKRYNSNSSNSNQPITIEGVELPLLDENDAIEQPFLALPKQLTAYHRSIVHDLCTDSLQLFHCGVDVDVDDDDGANEGERFVVVSIYSDGFDFVPGLDDTNHLPPVALRLGNCQPWITRHDVDSRSETVKRKATISEMIDYPGRCLRDAHDTIDLVELRDDNLGTIEAPKSTDTTCRMVSSAEEMQQCIRELEENTPTEIAFDIECYNKGKGLQITCLIQLATDDGREYVIDVLGGKNAEVWKEVHGLSRFFEDETIVKIGHGIRSLDVQSLQRDFGLFVVNAFDTYEAATVLGLPEKGLAKICAHYGLQNSELYKDLKQKYQASDWMHRPLTTDKILYGRYDVHYLVRLRRLMTRDLINNSCAAGERKDVFHAADLRINLPLMKVISKSQDNCLKLWNTAPEAYLNNKQFLALAKQRKKDGKDLTKSQLALYASLASWRETVARDEEALPGVICSLEYLARVAVHRPATEEGLRQIRCDLPQFLTINNRQHMAVMFGFVRESLAEDGLVPTEYPTYNKLISRSTRKGGGGAGDESRKSMLSSSSSSSSSMLSGTVFCAVIGTAILSTVLFVGQKRKGCKI